MTMNNVKNEAPNWEVVFNSIFPEVRSTIDEHPHSDAGDILNNSLAKCGISIENVDNVKKTPDMYKRLILLTYFDFLASLEIDIKAEKWDNVHAENAVIDVFNWTFTETGMEQYTSPKLSLDEYESKLERYGL